MGSNLGLCSSCATVMIMIVYTATLHTVHRQVALCNQEVNAMHKKHTVEMRGMERWVVEGRGGVGRGMWSVCTRAVCPPVPSSSLLLHSLYTGSVSASTLVIFTPPFLVHGQCVRQYPHHLYSSIHRHNKRLLQHRHEVASLAEKLMSKRANGSLPPVRNSKSTHRT